MRRCIFNRVHKATFEDCLVAAVKRFNKRKPGESFDQEVELLSSLNHRFRVNLVGYCEDFDVGHHTNSWTEEVNTIWRILDWEGIMTATLGSEPAKAFSTRVAGTPGYFDPEYIYMSVVSNKTDVFSYGVVLLELLTGRTPLLEERSTLANWAKPYLLSEDIGSIIDPQLEKGTFQEEHLRAVAEVARRCTENDSCNRPTRKEVMAVLTVVFNVESTMVNLAQRTSSIDFSGSNFTIDSQSRVLPGVSPREGSMNYTESEILPRD